MKYRFLISSRNAWISKITRKLEFQNMKTFFVEIAEFPEFPEFVLTEKFYSDVIY